VSESSCSHYEVHMGLKTNHTLDFTHTDTLLCFNFTYTTQ